MLVTYRLVPLSIPRPISYHHGPALCPKDCPLWVASLGSCRQWVWPIKALEGDQRRRKERRRRVVLPYSLPVLGCIFWQWLNPSRAVAPVSGPLSLWPQLSPWTPGMNAISSPCSWPSSDSSFPLLLVSGWQEPHVTLNSVYSSGSNPFIKVFWTIYIGLFLLPDLRIQTTDL